MKTITRQEFNQARQVEAKARELFGYEGGAVIMRRDGLSGFSDVGWCLSGDDHATGERFLYTDPRAWVPGVVAFDCSGVAFVAVGGCEYNGARRWDRLGVLS